VNRGKFQEDSLVSFSFGATETGWRLDKLVH